VTDRLEHIKTTPEGFTHWSSGPSNRIFDPQCGACWQEEVERLRDGSEYWGMNQELTEQIAKLRDALEAISATLLLEDAWDIVVKALATEAPQ